MFIELHIIQSLPASNPNRGKDGGAKSIPFGGTTRARLSSHSQKRATRLWYRDTIGADRNQLAVRSRRHDKTLADQLTWIDLPEHRLIMARFILSIFNIKKDNLIEAALASKLSNLMFLSPHEIDTIAVLASNHQEILLAILERILTAQELIAQERQGDDDEKQTSVDPKRYKNLWPTARELNALQRELVKISNTVPGDVALFGRMMAMLTETSIDGCVQVADAMSVNSFEHRKAEKGKGAKDPWVLGEIDFFCAMDDIEPDRSDEESTDAGQGAGYMEAVGLITPIYYRYANLCTSELERLVGDVDAAKIFAKGFLHGFVKSLPTGYVRSHAHMTLPEFVLVQVTERQPYQHAPAFINAIDEGGDLVNAAIAALLARRDRCRLIYEDHPIYEAFSSLEPMAEEVPFPRAIDGALAAAMGVTNG